MSGGSMDYVFSRIDDAADNIETYRKEVSERPVENFKASDISRQGRLGLAVRCKV